MVSVVICGSGGWGCSMVVDIGTSVLGRGGGGQMTVSSGGWGCCHIVNFVCTPSQ